MTSGILYVVATPIVNMEDISERAIKTLKEVTLILAEDTRHSSVLLNHFGINTQVAAFHEHNEEKALPGIIKRLKGGDTIALISDAGTPLISDPGHDLVAEALGEDIRVVPVPGPAAVIAALSVSGLPTDRFVYEGFLPAKQAARRKRLQELITERRTMVFYEVPHRINDTLTDMIYCFGPEHKATLAKELTKYYESVRMGTLVKLQTWLNEEEERKKGEFVILLHGCKSSGVDSMESVRVLDILLETMPVKEAAATAALILGENKNRMYRLALDIKKQEK